MSPDDFESRLRTRLADLADHEDDWADPLPGVRRHAAAGGSDADDLARGTRRRGRGWWPGLAVAAVVLAVLVGAGFGVRAMVDTGSSGSAGSSAQAAGGVADRSVDASSCAAPVGTACTAPQANGSAGTNGSGRPGPNSGAAGAGAAASCPSGTPAGGCHDTAGCQTQGAATSTGPLAAVAAIRPSGFVGPRVTSGGSAAIPYQLTFSASGGTVQLHAARAVWQSFGQVCAATGTATPDTVQNGTVAPGAGTSGSAVFTATDSRGEPLPAGDYQAVIVIPYSVGGSGMSQLVSAPVAVTVLP